MLRALSAIILLTAIYFLLSERQVQNSLSWEVAKAILLIQPLLLISTAIIAVRHSILVTVPRAPFLSCLAAVILSAGINLVIPGRIAEIVKATYLREKLNISLANGTAAIIVERLFDIFVVSLFTALGLVGIFTTSIPFLVTMSLAAMLALTLLHFMPEKLIGTVSGYKNRIGQFFLKNLMHFSVITSSKITFVSLFLTILSWSIHCFAVWVFFWALPQISITPLEACLIFGALIIGGSIPAMPAGVGTVQASVSFVLVTLGFEFTDALLFSIAIHIAEIVISALVSPIILLFSANRINLAIEG